MLTASSSGRPIPREKKEDLRVFPDNIHYRSEAVLSEPLKQAIYEDVTRNDVTVREASVKHQVDIRRVAAVVRLKAMEAAWVESVSFLFMLAFAFGSKG